MQQEWLQPELEGSVALIDGYAINGWIPVFSVGAGRSYWE
jgi:hypothetical protein